MHINEERILAKHRQAIAQRKIELRFIEFCRHTFVLRLFDEQSQESWPLIEFHEDGKVKDGFCYCEESDEENGCIHLAYALELLTDSQHFRLSQRFLRHFWHRFFFQLSQDDRLEANFDHESAIGELHGPWGSVEVEFSDPELVSNSTQIFEDKATYEPSSLRFSTLSPEELALWRAGRPNPAVRYELSICSLLARLLFLHDWQHPQEEVFVSLQEVPASTSKNPSGFYEFIIDRMSYEVRAKIKFELLDTFLSSINTLKNGLCHSFSWNECLQAVEYDKDEHQIIVHYNRQKMQEFRELYAYIENKGSAWHHKSWYYIPSKGLYYFEQSPDQWPGSLSVAHFLEHLEELQQQYSSTLGSMEIDFEERNCLYNLRIDESGNLHIDPYVFSLGDLQDPSAWILENWAYLPSRGLVKVSLDKNLPSLVEREKMADFIETHRPFFNQFPGFTCWTHGLDFKLDYFVNEDKLRFFSPHLSKDTAMRTYGHWIYIPAKGFFLDQSQLQEFQGIYHGLEIPKEEVETFLAKELSATEAIPRFWADKNPLEGSFIRAEVSFDKDVQVHLLPYDVVKAEYRSRKRICFGAYDYVEGHGFWLHQKLELLPENFRENRILHGEEIGAFLQEIQRPNSRLLKFFEAIPLALRKLDYEKIEVCDAQLAQESLENFHGRVYRLRIQLVLPEGGKFNLSLLQELPIIEERWILTPKGFIDLFDRNWRWLALSLKESEEKSSWFLADVLSLFKWNLRKVLRIKPGLKVAEGLEKDLQLLMGRDVVLPDLTYLKSILRPYQQLGVKWLWQLYRLGLGGLLCDDMGLGKTHQIMGLMAAIWTSNAQARTFFIACPTSVVFHWLYQLKQFLPDIPVHLYHGPGRKLPLTVEGIVLTTYGVCRLDIEHLSKVEFALAVFDEIQLAKNAQSRIYKSLERLQAQVRVGLSGTPVENSLRDLKALMDLAVSGWMPSHKQFEEEYLIPLERFGDRQVVSKVKAHVHPFVLRREKSEVLQDLPDKVVQTHMCALSDDQRAIYQSVLQQARGSLKERMDHNQRGLPYLHIFSALNALKQICDHPAVYFRNRGQMAQGHEYDCDKWDLFCHLLKEALASEQKVVVFSQYLSMLDLIEEYLHAHGIGYSSVRGNTRNRGERVERFQNDPDCKVFVASLHAAGVGIDLTAGSVVILYDRWWNAAKENQAIDRVHRIGQTKGVQVIRLMVQGSIEEKIDEIISRKASLMKEAVVTDDHRFLKSLSEDEILALLDFNAKEVP